MKPINSMPWIWVVLSTMLCVYSFYRTPLTSRNDDVGAHVELVKRMSSQLSMPSPDECFECYHPQLYYWTAGLTHRVFAGYGDLFSLQAVRMISVLALLGFSIFSILSLRFALDTGWVWSAASALIVFWPTAFIHAARLSNEPLFYFFFSGWFYFLLRWRYLSSNRSLHLSAVFCGLALLTKASALLALVITGFLVLNSVVKSRSISHLEKRWGWPLLWVIFPFGLWLWRFFQGKSFWPGTNINENPDLYLGNSFKQYGLISIQEFIMDPGAYFVRDGQVWSFLFKTSLYGRYETPLQSDLAPTMNFLCVILLVLVAVGVVRSWRKKWDLFAYFVLLLIVPVIAIVINRFKQPYPFAGDFRYIYPTVLPGAAFVGKALEGFSNENKIKLKAAAVVVITLFCGASIIKGMALR